MTSFESASSAMRSAMRRLVLARMWSSTTPLGSLGGQHQVHAEAAAALGDVDDAGDELGHLLLQEGELVERR